MKSLGLKSKPTSPSSKKAPLTNGILGTKIEPSAQPEKKQQP